ncbi:hypothetical protein [Methylosinus sp. Sm6]|uniref:hypothetical protein n=1 Tax=Methylosinus sp. Sm6 TaxID=2866948 RepID=UPI0021064DC3|nr:hypothetical protein [Methylosinus sp. Sm6]
MLALWRDDRTESPLTFDLRIDAASRRIVSHWDSFGACDLDGGKFRPFVLRRDGAIDFGAGARDNWRTDVRRAVMRVGERFTVHWNECDCGLYEIVKVATLGAKSEIGEKSGTGDA